MQGYYRFLVIVFALILIVWGLFFFVVGETHFRTGISFLTIGGFLLVLGVFNGGRRLFADDDDNEGVELLHDVTWRSPWEFALQNYAFLRVLSSKSAHHHRNDHRRKRVEEKRRRVESAKAQVAETDAPSLSSAEEASGAPAEVTEAPVTDTRRNRLSRARVKDIEAQAAEIAPATIVNSAWVWTPVCYVLVILIAMSMITQSGLDVFAERSRMPMLVSLVVLIYPAWRIGSLFSRFLRKRGIGSEAVLTVPVIGTKPEPKAGSIEARMAEREARVAKAREEGKL